MPNPPKKLYQCVGKEGTYEFLGRSTGAGTSRGHDVESYRDIHTGQLFHRLPDDFENRMECIGERVEFPQPYNPGHQIEGLDRCHTVLYMMHVLLDEHPAVLKADVMPLIEQARAAIHQAYHRIGLLEDRVDVNPEDPNLLREALDLLEYVTWHDGRYRQQSYAEFQGPAQKLVTRLAARLGVEPYQTQKSE